MSDDVVIVDYSDLAADPPTPGGGDGEPGRGGSSAPSLDLTARLAAAFGGPNSKGLVAVRGVPGFVEARDAFLPLAHPLAHLPPEYLEGKLTDEASLYNAGWSHGKEKLKADVPDLSKGSFYFNPLTDAPGTEEDRRRFPASYPRNVWPDEEEAGPGLTGFEEKAKRLGTIMHGAVVALARHIDAYATLRAKEDGTAYPPNLLHDAMRRTEKAKGRLLYYFPLPPAAADDGGERRPAEDSWIGWHNDSGFLTALAGDLYVDDGTGERLDPRDVDDEAGLYAVDRTGGTVKVQVPDDCMAVQIGECTQIVTGGAVAATPHCVRGARSGGAGSPRVARVSCPCFIDTPPSFPLGSPGSRQRVLEAGLGRDRVPPLGRRWTADGMAFGDFLARTFATYYDWNNKGEEEEGAGGGGDK